jgi:hypothetical protein
MWRDSIPIGTQLGTPLRDIHSHSHKKLGDWHQLSVLVWVTFVVGNLVHVYKQNHSMHSVELRRFLKKVFPDKCDGPEIGILMVVYNLWIEMSCLFPNWTSLLEGTTQAVSKPLRGLEVKSHYQVVLKLLVFATFSFSFVAVFLFYHGNLCV